MSVVNILDRLTKWAQISICNKIQLKVPPDDETSPTDEGYKYERMKPTAFTLYVPTKEKLPPEIISPFPSVCVRFMEGSDDITDKKGNIGIQLCFSAWNPGTHGKDVLIPSETDKLTLKRWTGEEAKQYFQRNSEGWRDVWSMVDIALREIESVTNIDGLVIDMSKPVKFGPLSEQDAIPDYYPFWFAWVSFYVTYPITRNIRDLENLL
jgi:hypothetical protein